MLTAFPEGSYCRWHDGGMNYSGIFYEIPDSMGAYGVIRKSYLGGSLNFKEAKRCETLEYCYF